MNTRHQYAMGYVDGLLLPKSRQFRESWNIDERIAYHEGFTQGVLDYIQRNTLEEYIETADSKIS